VLFFGRNVLESGAGGSLPGLVTAKGGARNVHAHVRKRLLIVDHKSLLDNLAYAT